MKQFRLFIPVIIFLFLCGCRQTAVSSVEHISSPVAETAVSVSSLQDEPVTDAISEPAEENTYYLPSPGDETDMTSAIAAMLETGVCRLGPGDFYVENLQMPDNSTLRGSGAATRLILKEEVTDGYAVKLGSCCTIEDLTVSGSGTEVTETLGTRHGIVFEGDADGENTGNPSTSIITNCYIDNFSGGGITCRNTGYSSVNSLHVTDCYIRSCSAGINVSYFSEYHRFTNVHTYECYYGCINNGGNNVFVNCSFSNNMLGFLIDNAQEQSPNNAHGSAIGCTFNHSGNNEGVGIRILNTQFGFVFTGCQLFYSKIELVDSLGITFDACNFGVDEDILVENGSLILFDGCLFGTPPEVTIENNENVEFKNCYTRDGIEISQ